MLLGFIYQNERRKFLYVHTYILDLFSPFIYIDTTFISKKYFSLLKLYLCKIFTYVFDVFTYQSEYQIFYKFLFIKGSNLIRNTKSYHVSLFVSFYKLIGFYFSVLWKSKLVKKKKKKLFCRILHPFITWINGIK